MLISRDRLVSVFLAGILGGVVLSWACGPVPDEANAQDSIPTPDCARFEILPLVINTEEDAEPGIIDEPQALGWPVSFAPGESLGVPRPQNVDEAKIAMPDGWEPIGSYGNFLLMRRCVL